MVDWRTLPSLSALRAFEAAARLGSFAAAARSLNVTPAAVAQQVRALEAELGLALLLRAGRGLVLTAEGERLAAALGTGFAAIADGIAAARTDDRRRGLRISATPAFAHSVLMPRLGEFWTEHPEIPVSLLADIRLVDLRRDGFDLAIRSGSGPWPDLQSELLATHRFHLAAAPSLLARGADLRRLPWLLATSLPQEFEWLRAAGYDPAELRIIDVPDGGLAMIAARSGYGLIFVSDAVLRAELRNGALEIVPFPDLPELSYHAVTLPGPRRAAVEMFVAWLRPLLRL